MLSNGDTTYYCIVDNATGAWEVGLGTYASAGPSLARTSVIASSTGAAVSFGAGPKDVFITLPADRVVTTDGADFNGPVTVPAGATGTEVPQAQEIFGKGQSWQAVTRISGVTYTNSTGKPITVIAIAEVIDFAPGLVYIEVDGVHADQDWGWELAATMVVNFVVPPGSTYKITGTNASAFFATEYR